MIIRAAGENSSRRPEDLTGRRGQGPEIRFFSCGAGQSLSRKGDVVPSGAPGLTDHDLPSSRQGPTCHSHTLSFTPRRPARRVRRDAEAFLLDIGARLTGLLGHLGGEDGLALGCAFRDIVLDRRCRRRSGRSRRCSTYSHRRIPGFRTGPRFRSRPCRDCWSGSTPMRAGSTRTPPIRLRPGSAAPPETDRPRGTRGRLTRHLRAVVQ